MISLRRRGSERTNHSGRSAWGRLATRWLFCAALLSALPLATTASAAERVALVIGNSRYEGSGFLRNPVQDAEAIERALKPLGFTVIARKDATLDQMEDALVEFRRSLPRGGLGLFFYAGHGLQVKGENYLVPIGARMREEYEVKRQCLDVSQVVEAMHESECNLKVIVLDCCRNNPFQRSWTRSSAAGGLAQMTVPEGTVVAFSTSPNATAADGSGDNSPYTDQLVRVLQSRPAEGLELTEVFREASRAGKRQTGQVPWLSLEASLEKYFLWRAMDAGLASSKPGLTSSKPAVAGSGLPPTRPPFQLPATMGPATAGPSTMGPATTLFPSGSAPGFGSSSIDKLLAMGQSVDMGFVRAELQRATEPKQGETIELAIWIGGMPDTAASAALREFIFKSQPHKVQLVAACTEGKDDGPAIHLGLIPRPEHLNYQASGSSLLQLPRIDVVLLLGFTESRSLATAILATVQSGRDCIVMPDNPTLLRDAVQRLRAQQQIRKLFDRGRIVWIRPGWNTSYDQCFEALKSRVMGDTQTILRYLEASEYPIGRSDIKVVFETSE